MKKTIIVMVTLLIILILILLQSMFFNQIPLFGIVPNIGIIFISIIALFAGEHIGALVGATYGILIDCCFERTFGICFGLFLLFGFIAGKFKNQVSKDNKWSFFVPVVVFTIIFELVRFLLNVVLFNIGFELLYLIKVIALEELYNIFLAFIFYKPFVLWGDIINRSRKSYYNF